MTRRQRGRTARPAVSTFDAGSPAFGISPSFSSKRVFGIDVLRGLAILLMIVYHFSFDLRFYHVTRSDFEHDPFWLAFRALIVTGFMLLVGIGLVLAARAQRPAADAVPLFWRRIAIIAACALLASAASYALFPQSFIYFGILHAIAVASVLAWPFVQRPRLALVAGILIVASGLWLSNPIFDQRALSWIGFTTTKPNTEDYVPLAPWMGVVLLGVALGHALVAQHFRPVAALARAPGWLAWCGRHSLAIYMAHQPVLLGVLWMAVGR
jgi:uncharacterized membrane protein